MADADATQFPLGFVWRVEMVRVLEPLPEAPLPEGYAFAPFQRHELRMLAELEHRAFLGTPDAEAFAQHLHSPAASRSVWAGALRSGSLDERATVLLRSRGELCGFALVTRARGRIGYLTSVAVSPVHRGGTGRALVAECLRRMRALGMMAARLTVTAENGHALRLYERLGFDEVGWSVSTFRRVR